MFSLYFHLVSFQQNKTNAGLSQYDAQNFQDALETFDSGIERVSQSKDHDTAPLKAVHARLCDTKAKTLFALGESDKAIASWTRGFYFRKRERPKKKF